MEWLVWCVDADDDDDDDFYDAVDDDEKFCFKTALFASEAASHKLVAVIACARIQSTAIMIFMY